MLEDYFIKLVVIICWLIFPSIWIGHRMNWFIKLAIWWKVKDEKDVILPSISFFFLPFLICIAYQSIYQLITNSHGNNHFSMVIDTVIKIIPMATICTYFLDKIKKDQQIQLSKDMLSSELFQNYLTTNNILSLIQLSNFTNINLQEKPIQCFRILWSTKAYDNIFLSIINMKSGIYNDLSELYRNANLIINMYGEDDTYNSYFSVSDNQMLITRLSLLINELYRNLILLNNKSEIGLFILENVEKMQQERLL
ncbi:hypothetical protein [Anabaena subtropica]|uniref:Uncharacterized protein n=1 Tax=Anabaena subtropica FACHB-260 TaxID=2692884 RepID=A0ABR8CTA1_9NOST|nr:hypothetical protein [Anabaena subtropica]MBD2345603.1 hypothetical protein [Anabaena subtropica FACHB-260]